MTHRKPRGHSLVSLELEEMSTFRRKKKKYVKETRKNGGRKAIGGVISGTEEQMQESGTDGSQGCHERSTSSGGHPSGRGRARMDGPLMGILEVRTFRIDNIISLKDFTRGFLREGTKDFEHLY